MAVGGRICTDAGECDACLVRIPFNWKVDRLQGVLDRLTGGVDRIGHGLDRFLDIPDRLSPILDRLAKSGPVKTYVPCTRQIQPLCNQYTNIAIFKQTFD